MKKLTQILLTSFLAFICVYSVANAYVVKQGDTLWKIAQNAGISLTELINLNPQIDNPNLILVGEEINTGGLGAALPNIAALFESSLQNSVASDATTMTLVSATLKNGSTLSGLYGFIIDEGNSNEEFVLCQASSTALTACLRGIDPVDGKTEVASLKYSHRRGASIKITDYPILGIMRRILNGQETLPNFLSYTTSTSLMTADGQLATKYYVDTVGAGGFTSVNVSTTRGLSVDGSSPEKVGINASTTLGGAFDDNGAYYQKTTTGLSNGSNGIGIDYANNNIWTGTNTFNGTTTFGVNPFNIKYLSLLMCSKEDISKNDAVSISDGTLTVTDHIIDAAADSLPTTTIGETRYSSQIFTATTTAYNSATFNLTGVSVRLDKPGGLTGNMTVSIRNTSANLPTGSDIVSKTIDANSTVPDAPASYVDFIFSSPLTITAGTKYAVVISYPSATQYIDWAINTSNPYSGGTAAFSADSGSSWSASSTADFSLKLYTSEEIGYIIKSSASSNNNRSNSFLGFAVSDIANGSCGQIAYSGIFDGFTGLTVGTTTYMGDTNGSVSSTVGSVSRKLGISVSSTAILIKHDNP